MRATLTVLITRSIALGCAIAILVGSYPCLGDRNIAFQDATLADRTGKSGNSVAKILLADPSPRRGRPDAPVTLVEFGDLQCPQCTRFLKWYEVLPGPTRSKVAVVFKHFPLPSHPWSRTAAEATACAAFQSDDAFWLLHDFFLTHQKELTPENMRNQTRDMVAASRIVNSEAFEKCVNQHDSEQIIDRDRLLAKQLGVHQTPTIYLNGRRMHLMSFDELTIRVNDELDEEKMSSPSKK